MRAYIVMEFIYGRYGEGHWEIAEVFSSKKKADEFIKARTNGGAVKDEDFQIRMMVLE